jgi:spermidine synthase
VVAAARTFFGLPVDDRRLKVLVGDGAEHVLAHRGACDVFLLDAFDDLRSVRSLATEAFYAGCRDTLRPGGVFAVNFIADEPRFGTYLARIERVFDGRVLCLPSQDRMNMIVLAFRGPVAPIRVAPLKRTARQLERSLGLPFDRFVRDLVAHNPGDARHLGFRAGAD